jgi:hypothetical protein
MQGLHLPDKQALFSLEIELHLYPCACAGTFDRGVQRVRVDSTQLLHLGQGTQHTHTTHTHTSINVENIYVWRRIHRAGPAQQAQAWSWDCLLLNATKRRLAICPTMCMLRTVAQSTHNHS